jgi:hypothetical protein
MCVTLLILLVLGCCSTMASNAQESANLKTSFATVSSEFMVIQFSLSPLGLCYHEISLCSQSAFALTWKQQKLYYNKMCPSLLSVFTRFWKQKLHRENYKGKTYSEIFSVIGGYVTLKENIFFLSCLGGGGRIWKMECSLKLL